MSPTRKDERDKGHWRPALSPRRLVVGVLVTASATLTLGLLSGCRSVEGFDEFSFKKMNFEVFRDPQNPVEVIHNSTSGSARARALRCLREPATSGGSQKDQDSVIAMVNYCAGHDSQAYCRLAAIETLTRFQDPRVTEGLREAYYRAGSFPPETASVIRCQALAGLGETRSVEGVDVLVRVLREPPTGGPDVDKQLKYNEKIAAASALGNFTQYEATSALVEVLRAEQENIALRNRAHQSLVRATGKHIPADARAWEEFFRDPANAKVPPPPSVSDRLLQLTRF